MKPFLFFLRSLSPSTLQKKVVVKHWTIYERICEHFVMTIRQFKTVSFSQNNTKILLRLAESTLWAYFYESLHPSSSEPILLGSMKSTLSFQENIPKKCGHCRCGWGIYCCGNIHRLQCECCLNYDILNRLEICLECHGVGWPFLFRAALWRPNLTLSVAPDINTFRFALFGRLTRQA